MGDLLACTGGMNVMFPPDEPLGPGPVAAQLPEYLPDYGTVRFHVSTSRFRSSRCVWLKWQPWPRSEDSDEELSVEYFIPPTGFEGDPPQTWDTFFTGAGDMVLALLEPRVRSDAR